ncbi:uncharacterized protein TRUGW13939_11541 [Talaromyces rugulosus]|uniref:Uncharacterized protein n=1 Tax=Talaromyces rugulosus TaxID=121627 RepID=A0A7H8RE36_TALRU|nr:uncharacterized protein TRUGW13939_11541 [Talaromyces rugulosus]QKX64367.1 hypothetical protein TRUGW13939_11541 [Talaromyces rugulosus]
MAYQSLASPENHAEQIEMDERRFAHQPRIIKHGKGHEKNVNSVSAWSWEIASVAGSLLTKTAIVVLLAYYGGRPLADWNSSMPYDISLNAVIAVLTTGNKAFMLYAVSSCIGQAKWFCFKSSQRLHNMEIFDEASRGSSGSVWLIFKVAWNFATIGAIITVLALGIDPFTQQVVQLNTRNVTVDDPDSTFGFAHEYNRNSTISANSYLDSFPQDFQMQGAIYKALYGLDTRQKVNCAGTCVWDGPYYSLGFSSNCSNVTMQTLESQKCGKDATNTAATLCNMTTPGGVQLSKQDVETDSVTSFQVHSVSHLEDVKFEDVGTAQINFLTLAVYMSSFNGNYEALGENITECTLSLAGFEYSNITAQGSSFSLGNPRQIDLHQGSARVVTNDSDALGLTGSDIVFETSGVPALTISWQDWMALSNFFTSSSFQANYVSGNARTQTTPGAGQALDGADVPNTFKAMTSSMTDYVRNGPNMQLAQGQRVNPVIYVTVLWEWLILPLFLEVAALLFTFTLIVRSCLEAHVPIWKSSALALLAYQYDETTGVLCTQINRPERLKQFAKETTAHLE